MDRKSKKKVNKIVIRILIALVAIAVVIGGVYWGVDKYKDNQRKEAAEKKIAEWKAKIDADPTDAKAWINYGKLLHDANRVDESIAALKKTLELVPNSAPALAYYGSALTKKANQVSAIDEKMEYLQEGLDIMDKNVEENPNHFIARLVRAENSYYLPDMFERIGTSIEDFEKLITISENDEQYVDLKSYVMLRLGQSYKKDKRPDEARKILEQVIAEFPGTHNAKEAQKVLKTLK